MGSPFDFDSSKKWKGLIGCVKTFRWRSSMPIKIADRVEIDPQVHHGKPVIAGTRVRVHMILGLLSNGLMPQEIICDYYEHISREDILACIRYAKSLVEEEEVYPVK